MTWPSRDPRSLRTFPVLLTYRQSVAYTLVCALAKQHQLAPARVTGLPGPARAENFIDKYVVHTLETLVRPTLTDPYVSDRLAGVVKLSLYRRDLLAYGPDRLEREEIRAIESLTQASHASLSDARAAACALARTLTASQGKGFIRYLLEVSGRNQAIWSAAMGEMANRRLEF